MLNNNNQRATSSSATGNNNHEDDDELLFRDIHPLTPPPPLPPPPGRRRESWETTGSSLHRSSSLSMASETASSENFTTISREFNALVIAGSAINESDTNTTGIHNNLDRIGEEDNLPEEETNPLAIVPDSNPMQLHEPSRATVIAGTSNHGPVAGEVMSVHRVKKEEVESKISAWQNGKIAKINNRFKREDAIINGWEGEQVHKATSWMKKVERKLEEKRARALEKMQNEVAKAHRKAEERRASAEAKRGTKVARVLEISNLMRAVGRPPAKRSFF